MLPEPPTPEPPRLDIAPQNVEAHGVVSGPVPVPTVAPTGKRQAFRDIRRQLQEAELASPGVQKLLLEELETADSRCEVLEGYIDRFHDADKQAAVLVEKLRTQTALEIAFGVGVGLGCALMSLASVFWDGSMRGPLALVIGFLLVIGAVVARVVKQ